MLASQTDWELWSLKMSQHPAYMHNLEVCTLSREPGNLSTASVVQTHVCVHFLSPFFFWHGMFQLLGEIRFAAACSLRRCAHAEEPKAFQINDLECCQPGLDVVGLQWKQHGHYCFRLIRLLNRAGVWEPHKSKQLLTPPGSSIGHLEPRYATATNNKPPSHHRGFVLSHYADTTHVLVEFFKMSLAV